jgi:hypothetical protein
MNTNNNKDSIDDNSTQTLQKNSFFNVPTIRIKNINLTCLAPKELEYNELLIKENLNFNDEFEVKDKEGVFCKNQEVLKRQEGVFTDMAKQLAKNIFSSGTISLSLPIRIFEPRSMLERYIDWWSFAPVLLKKAGSLNDKLEAFKYAICFTLSGLFSSAGQMKPFNPLLGETYQAKFEDGSDIYVEHTSHIPPISNYLINDKDGLYKLYGYCDISVEGAMKVLFNNYMYCVPKGKCSIYLKNTNQTIHYQNPRVVLGGMIIGSRYAYWDGHMKFEDRENGLKAIIWFNFSHPNLKNRRIHDIYGQIFKYDYSKDKKKEFYEAKLSKSSLPDQKNVICTITGSWLEYLVFDNKILWTISESIPYRFTPVENSLPSDPRYREDLIWLKKSKFANESKATFEEFAQQWKIALEVQQRYDRSLRQKK